MKQQASFESWLICNMANLSPPRPKLCSTNSVHTQDSYLGHFDKTKNIYLQVSGEGIKAQCRNTSTC